MKDQVMDGGGRDDNVELGATLVTDLVMVTWTVDWMITVVVGSSAGGPPTSEVAETGLWGRGCTEGAAPASEVGAGAGATLEVRLWSAVTVVVLVVVTVTVDGPSVFSGQR